MLNHVKYQHVGVTLTSEAAKGGKQTAISLLRPPLGRRCDTARSEEKTRLVTLSFCETVTARMDSDYGKMATELTCKLERAENIYIKTGD